MVNEQDGDDPAVHITVVVPLEKNDPEAGKHVTVPQVPMVVGAA